MLRKLEGSRKRGRPSLRWTDSIKNTHKTISVNIELSRSLEDKTP